MKIAQVELNIADEAIDRGVPGTANLDTSDYTVGFGNLLGSILSIVMTIAGVIVLIYLIWGAMEWVTSGGDKGKLEKARLRIMHGILGLIVLSAVLAIFMVVQEFLGIEVFSFNFQGGT